MSEVRTGGPVAAPCGRRPVTASRLPGAASGAGCRHRLPRPLVPGTANSYCHLTSCPPRARTGLALRRTTHRPVPSAEGWCCCPSPPHKVRADESWALVSRSSRVVRVCGATGESPAARRAGISPRRRRCSMHSRCHSRSGAARADRDSYPSQSTSLAKQLASASESVALNLGEGRLRRDGDRRRHFEMAAGSASEVTVALRIAVAKRYITAAEAAEVDAVLDRVRAMLYRLTR